MGDRGGSGGGGEHVRNPPPGFSMTRLPSLGMSSPAVVGSGVSNSARGGSREHRWMDGGDEAEAQQQHQREREGGGEAGHIHRHGTAGTSTATAGTRHGWTSLLHSSGSGGGGGGSERFGDV
ncbi:unnamed protein product, partial [Laminaria digitata]